MSYELELDDELGERIERHLEDDETPEEFIAELLSIYETEGVSSRRATPSERIRAPAT